MYTLDDLTNICRETIDCSFRSAHEFALEKKARPARISLEAVEACQMVMSNKDMPESLNNVLHICADLCDYAADEAEGHTSLHALRSAVACRKCSKICRAFIQDIKWAA